MPYKPTVLVVLDGYGVNLKTPESTWKYFRRPNFKRLERRYPFTVLQASGSAVGLPWGEEGNSEVGHLTIGAGRVIFTHLPRIITAIQDGSFFENGAFKKAVLHAQKNNSRLHLMGLFSSGSVHSYPDHLYALLELARRNRLKELHLHLFTDGRDAFQKEAAKFFGLLELRLAQEYPFAKIASVVGRHFAMDRDSHWDSIEKTYNLFTSGLGQPYESAPLYIEESYKKGVDDEFIEPGFLVEHEEAVGRIRDNDAVVFFNFREDSARELTGVFVSDAFDKFPRTKINNLFFVTMTEYDKTLKTQVAFEPMKAEEPLAKIISDAGFKQLRVAETEKYAHVTYFFNGGKEKPYAGEDRILVQSLKTAHFDEVPQMSASEITEKVLESLLKYDFILVNFANADMVGHTGDFGATVKALEALDEAVGKIIPKVLESGGATVIVGDHGNAEEKQYRISGEKRTKHTANPVPFFVVANGLELAGERTEEEIFKNYSEVKGTLTDVAPTALELLGLKKSRDMTGVSLLGSMR